MMQSKSLVLGTLLSVGMLGVASAQAPEAPPAPQQQQEEVPPAPQQQQAKPEVGDKLEQAHESVDSQNMTDAAGKMREAGKEIQALAADAPKGERKRLDKAAKQLDGTAKKIDAGQTVEQRAAETTLAESAHALASYHRAEAERALGKKDRKGLAMHLEQGGKDLGRAAKWTGVETERGVRDVVGGTTEAAGKITEGVGEIPKQTGRVIDDLGRGIDRVGKDITARHKTDKKSKEG